MATKVVEANEVSINGVYYPISRPVQVVLASLYPAKITIGDTSRDSQTRASVISWADWRGGLGTERMEGAVDVDKAWWSTAQLRYKRHLVLPELAVQTAEATSYTGSASDGQIAEYGNEIYTAYSEQIFKYSNAADSWGSSLRTLTSAATDNLTVRLSDVSYLIFAYSSGFDYYNGSAWATNSKDATYLAWWDNKLWGIDDTGQLWYAATPNATPTDDAQLPLPDNYVTDLFTARNAAGSIVLYAATKLGLYAHDAANAKWVETEVAFPYHEFNGSGTKRWRDSVYIPSGQGIYKYINGSNNAVITTVGLDKDDGLPSDERGVVKRLDASHNELFAMVDASATNESGISNTTTMPGYQWSSVTHGHGSPVIEASSGKSAIYGYNEVGWQTKWLSTENGRGIQDTLVSNAYNTYRLWWLFNNRVYYMALSPDIVNPSQVADFDYAETATHETPWFDAGQVEVDKLALTLKIEATGLSSGDTATDHELIDVSYALDYSTTYVSLGRVDSTTVGSTEGIKTYNFGDSDSVPNGKDFRAIKFKFDLARTAGTTYKANSPDLISTTFSFRKKLDVKFGHTVTLNLSTDYKGNTPMGLRSNLVSAIENKQLVEFTFRDDSGGTRNYYVDIASASGLEYTGYDERGQSQILLVEP